MCKNIVRALLLLRCILSVHTFGILTVSYLTVKDLITVIAGKVLFFVVYYCLSVL
jgi:hypothetical protein